MDGCKILLFLNLWIFLFVQKVHPAPSEYFQSKSYENGDYDHSLIVSDEYYSSIVHAKLKDFNGQKIYRLTGEYQFQDEKGVNHKVIYKADENGFKTRSISGPENLNYPKLQTEPNPSKKGIHNQSFGSNNRGNPVNNKAPGNPGNNKSKSKGSPSGYNYPKPKIAF